MKYFLKLFTLWAFLINSAFGQGDPAPFVKGIGSTGLGNSASTILVPNQQSTKINAYQALIETGNKNLLINPSFEHSIITTGWSISNATASKVSGPDKNALRLTLTGALSVVQDSTLNAANLIELQGVASIKIKTSTVDGLKVCARNDGVTTTLCVNVPKDGKWKEPTIPFSLSGTSNGIAIVSTGTTGTVDLDDSAVGTSLPIQGVGGAKLMGTVTITGCAAAWSTASGTFASFATQTGCSYSTTGQALAPSTNIPAIKFASLPAGDYRLEYEGLIGSSGAANNAFFQFSDGTNTAREQSEWNGSGGATLETNGINQSISYSSAQSNVTLSIKAKVVGSATASIYGSTANPGVIKVWYFPPESKIYSQASQDYDWTAYTPNSPNGSFGTLTNTECYHKRKGSDLYVDCKLTAGTVTSSEGQISLPSGLTSTTFPSIRLAGDLGSDSNNVNARTLIEPSKSYFTFGAIDSVRNALTKYGANIVAASNGKINIHAGPIPIQGWQDYGVIVGSFAGLEKCANDYECTGEYTAHMNSSQVISNQNLEGWITGNAGNPTTGVYTIPIKSGLFTQVPNCTATHTSIGSNAYTTKFDKTNSTTSSLRFIIMNTNSGNVVNVVSGEGFVINCQKAGVDFKPKTAKVASSIGVPTVPGVTTSGTGNTIDTFSFSYGTTNATTVCSASPCSYLDQIGNAVTSVTRSGSGAYAINLGKTYSKLKCSFSGDGSGGYVVQALGLSCSSCSSLSFTTRTSQTNTVNDSYGTLYCQGSY